jgi:hypothetical protein
MIDQDIESQPVYGRLAVDASGSRHLLVTDASAFSAAQIAGGPVDLEVWSVSDRACEGVTRPPDPDAGHGFRSVRHLLDGLAHRLARERMGLRLYALGQESFLWDEHGIGHGAPARFLRSDH